MGRRMNADGQPEQFFSFPTAVIFRGGTLELAGLRPLLERGDEIYGMKEALHAISRQKAEAGSAQAFLQKCSEHGYHIYDAIRILLENRWCYIKKYVHEQLQDMCYEIIRSTFTVPASQASDDILEGESHGHVMQSIMRQCAIESGQRILSPLSEPSRRLSHLNWQRGLAQASTAAGGIDVDRKKTLTWFVNMYYKGGAVGMLTRFGSKLFST